MKANNPIKLAKKIMAHSLSEGICEMSTTETVICEDVADANVLSAALVAITIQLPAPVPVRVEPLNVQGPLTRI